MDGSIDYNEKLISASTHVVSTRSRNTVSPTPPGDVTQTVPIRQVRFSIGQCRTDKIRSSIMTTFFSGKPAVPAPISLLCYRVYRAIARRACQVGMESIVMVL